MAAPASSGPAAAPAPTVTPITLPASGIPSPASSATNTTQSKGVFNTLKSYIGLGGRRRRTSKSKSRRGTKRRASRRGSKRRGSRRDRR